MVELEKMLRCFEKSADRKISADPLIHCELVKKLLARRSQANSGVIDKSITLSLFDERFLFSGILIPFLTRMRERRRDGVNFELRIVSLPFHNRVFTAKEESNRREEAAQLPIGLYQLSF